MVNYRDPKMNFAKPVVDFAASSRCWAKLASWGCSLTDKTFMFFDQVKIVMEAITVTNGITYTSTNVAITIITAIKNITIITALPAITVNSANGAIRVSTLTQGSIN